MKIMAVLPAYNAAKTLEKTLRELPREVDDVLLVDDASKDNTADVARSLGLRVIRHEKNRGYGGNQKTCYTEALRTDADVVVMVHPDYQYDPRVVRVMADLIGFGNCDIVLGNRIRTRAEALGGGMPLYKYIANRGLTFMENLVTGQNLGEWHSGLRAYSRRVLETLSWEKNSDDFVFDTQFLFQAAHAGFKIADIPVPAKYFREASSINLRRSTIYGLSSLVEMATFLLNDWGLLHTPRFVVKK